MFDFIQERNLKLPNHDNFKQVLIINDELLLRLMMNSCQTEFQTYRPKRELN